MTSHPTPRASFSVCPTLIVNAPGLDPDYRLSVDGDAEKDTALINGFLNIFESLTINGDKDVDHRLRLNGDTI